MFNDMARRIVWPQGATKIQKCFTCEPQEIRYFTSMYGWKREERFPTITFQVAMVVSRRVDIKIDKKNQACHFGQMMFHLSGTP